MRRQQAAALVAGFLVFAAALSGCGGSRSPVKDPFAVWPGVESGPGSGAWGDSYSGPKGNRVGCIAGRRFAVLITVRNRTNRTLTLLGGGGPQTLRRVIERVAVQVRIAQRPPNGDLAVVGLRGWNRRNSPPVLIPPGRYAWVQSNFLMKDCALLRAFEPVTVNRSTTLTYSVDGRPGVQMVAARYARIILTRGPRNPSVPINQVG